MPILGSLKNILEKYHTQLKLKTMESLMSTFYPFFISGIWLTHGQSERCPPQKNKLNFKIIIQNNFEPFFTTLGKSSINRLNKIWYKVYIIFDLTY